MNVLRQVAPQILPEDIGPQISALGVADQWHEQMLQDRFIELLQLKQPLVNAAGGSSQHGVGGGVRMRFGHAGHSRLVVQ